MDRKQAQANIGKLIIINEGQEGSYVGVLNDVIAPPRKTWRGEVTIQAVAELPAFKDEEGQLTLPPLKYIENEVIDCIGSKLYSLENEEDHIHETYRDSILHAAKKRYLEMEQKVTHLAAEKEALSSYLAELGIENEFSLSSSEEREENSIVNYKFFKQNGRFSLIDEHGEQLDLEDCPFEFGWSDGTKTHLGHYTENGVFLSKDGTHYTPNEGAVFSISQKQFDPYFILQNELEPEALHSLEHNLNSFGLTHDHLIDCHNTLLGQFLHADGKKTFKGVNFLTYRNHRGVVVVQHHFERKLRDQANDEIYDRFEFTTSNGQRSIATFTNEFSN